MNDKEKKANRLASQWPKQCGCGRVYVFDVNSPTKGPTYKMLWTWLPLVQNDRMPAGQYTDAFATMEMRNCRCGSTLAVYTEIHDLAAE